MILFWCFLSTPSSSFALWCNGLVASTSLLTSFNYSTKSLALWLFAILLSQRFSLFHHESSSGLRVAFTTSLLVIASHYLFSPNQHVAGLCFEYIPYCVQAPEHLSGYSGVVSRALFPWYSKSVFLLQEETFLLGTACQSLSLLSSSIMLSFFQSSQVRDPPLSRHLLSSFSAILDILVSSPALRCVFSSTLHIRISNAIVSNIRNGVHFMRR